MDMRISAGFAIPLLIVSLIEPETVPSAEPGPRTQTLFGHVRVDEGNVRVAVEEGEAAYSAARNVLGLQDARFDIVETHRTSSSWGDTSSDGLPLYVWPFRRSGSNGPQPPPAYLLRHEIGHDLFIRYLVPRTRGDQYGGDAPDWLDEMAAVAFEGEPLRTSRRRAAVRYAREGALIPLRRFLTMVHPEMAAGSIPDSRGREVVAFEPASDETPKFYVMASAFYDFLVVRTGNTAIVAELAAAVRNGERLEPWLLRRTGHADRAEDIEALNARFLAWIASDPRYGGASGR